MTVAVAQDGPLAIKPAQAAKQLNLSDKRVYELLAQGKLPGFKVDGRWLINARRLQAWMDEQTDAASGK